MSNVVDAHFGLLSAARCHRASQHQVEFDGVCNSYFPCRLYFFDYFSKVHWLGELCFLSRSSLKHPLGYIYSLAMPISYPVTAGAVVRLLACVSGSWILPMMQYSSQDRCFIKHAEWSLVDVYTSNSCKDPLPHHPPHCSSSLKLPNS